MSTDIFVGGWARRARGSATRKKTGAADVKMCKDKEHLHGLVVVGLASRGHAFAKRQEAGHGEGQPYQHLCDIQNSPRRLKVIKVMGNRTHLTCRS